MRLFIAMDPPVEQREKLQMLQQRLAYSLDGVKWIAPDGLHLTLKFLGEQEEERLHSIVDAMRKTAGSTAPFYLQFARIGLFPSPQRARIIWTGIGTGAAETKELAALLEDELARRGFPLERRPFKAHLTLGRIRRPLPAERLLRLLGAENNFTTGTAAVRSMHLYESRLSPHGARYTKLEEIIFMEK